MNTRFRAIFAAFALLLALAPVSAFAEHSTAAGAHSRTASYHDRTPVAHTSGTHSGHHRG